MKLALLLASIFTTKEVKNNGIFKKTMHQARKRSGGFCQHRLVLSNIFLFSRSDLRFIFMALFFTA